LQWSRKLRSEYSLLLEDGKWCYRWNLFEAI